MASISAVVLTKNEDKNIERCIDSLLWCDEIILIDDNSSDSTTERAKNRGAKVYKHSLSNNFSAQRNYALKQAKGEWILFVDADEVVSKELQQEINREIKNTHCNGYFLKRKDYFLGKWLRFGEISGVKLLRLARKNMGEWEGSVHEVWKIKGNISELTFPLLHYPHQSIEEFLRDINRYSTLRANELYSKHIKVSWVEIILYPLGKFILSYKLRLGFLDGIPGLILAIMMSLHSFLVRGKLWLSWQKR